MFSVGGKLAERLLEVRVEFFFFRFVNTAGIQEGAEFVEFTTESVIPISCGPASKAMPSDTQFRLIKEISLYMLEMNSFADWLLQY